LNYGNILLKEYYDVANSGNTNLLLVSGNYDEQDATMAWEEIIRENCKATNNRKYLQYMEASKEHRRLLNEQAFIKGALITLHFKIDHDLIKELGSKGYRINTDNSNKYAESLSRAERQSRSLNTRITVQENLIKRIHGEEEKFAKNRSGGIQTSLVRVGTALGLVLPQDILLSTFNEYFNIVKDQQADRRKVA